MTEAIGMAECVVLLPSEGIFHPYHEPKWKRTLSFVIPSVPEFPATLRRTRSRVRLSVRKGA